MMEPLHGSLQGFMIENMPLNELIYEFKSFKREFPRESITMRITAAGSVWRSNRKLSG